MERNLLRLHSGLFRDWQRTHTQSSVTAARPETANGCPVLQRQEPQPRGAYASWDLVYTFLRAPPQRASGEVCFLLTFDLHGCRLPGKYAVCLLPLVGLGRHGCRRLCRRRSDGQRPEFKSAITLHNRLISAHSEWRPRSGVGISPISLCTVSPHRSSDL
jgi:hypothetical protein